MWEEVDPLLAQVWTTAGTMRLVPRWALKDGDKTPGASLLAGSCLSRATACWGVCGGASARQLCSYITCWSAHLLKAKIVSSYLSPGLSPNLGRAGGAWRLETTRTHQLGRLTVQKGFRFQQEGLQAEGSRRQTQSVHLRERDLRPSPWPAPSVAWTQEQACAPFTGVTDARRRQSGVVWPVLV